MIYNVCISYNQNKCFAKCFESYFVIFMGVFVLMADCDGCCLLTSAVLSCPEVDHLVTKLTEALQMVFSSVCTACIDFNTLSYRKKEIHFKISLFKLILSVAFCLCRI